MTDTSQISDGYHIFEELYLHRHALFLALMKAMPERSWISLFHSDGQFPFGDPEWFIAGIELPPQSPMMLFSVPITYHLPKKLWLTAKMYTGAKILEKAPEWDGHTSEEVIVRLLDFVTEYQGPPN